MSHVTVKGTLTMITPHESDDSGYSTIEIRVSHEEWTREKVTDLGILARGNPRMYITFSRDDVYGDVYAALIDELDVHGS